MAEYLDNNNIIPCAIRFSDIPPSTDVGNQQITPFTISISAFDTNPHVIDLYAQYSRSNVYQDPQNKWSHLIPQWRFLDIDGNYITSITTTDTIITSGNEILGVTGSAQFYFVDDMGSLLGYPDVLWATMQVSGLPVSRDGQVVPSYANSKVVTYLPYYINDLAPVELHITRNGIDPMSSSVYWVSQNIPHIITINSSNTFNIYCSTENPGVGILYQYPSSNEFGDAMGPIDRRLITTPLSTQHWTSLDTGAITANFQAFDSNGFPMGGYSRNNVISDIVALNTQISASVNIAYESPYRDTTFLWISNPNNNTLHKLNKAYINPTVISQITSWLEEQKQQTNIIFDTPYLNTKIQQMSLTGFGGIYGIAVDPCYNVWCSDGELDKIYKFSYNGTLLSTIDLSDSTLLGFGISGGCTPAGISLDETTGLWISLFDSTSVLKFDRTNCQLLTVINPGGNIITPISGFGIDADYKPTLVETDRNNDIWVSFTNTLCSCLYKYDTNGNQLLTVTLPVCSNPMDIVIDYDNNVWTSLTYYSSHPNVDGRIQKINGSNGTKLISFSASHPEYLTMDKIGNIWYTDGFNSVKKINILDNSISTYVIGNTTLPAWYDTTSENNYNCLEGIACDSANRIWVINSYENKVYILSGNNRETIEFQDDKTTWYLDGNLNVISVSSPWEKSLQAFGDWSGLRWLQKYSNTVFPSTLYLTITGISDTFSIDSFSGYDIRKFNESWDTTNQIRNYALPEHVYNNENLFVNYIGTMIGGLETSANALGRRSYERIANFVANHVDVDTANIPQLYALAEKMDVPIDEYNFHYPMEIKRLMDIVSIPHKTLWGERCHCNTNFKTSYDLCESCGHKHNGNRGDVIDTTTYIVSANRPFLAEYRFDRNNYEIINPMVSSTNIFQIASSYLINNSTDYCYYEYDPTFCGVQNEGIISWDDEYTTLSENISGIDDWYGKGKLIEKMLSYYLHKGLGF